MHSQPFVAEELQGQAQVWGPEFNGRTSANLLACFDEWALHEADLIQVNCGLHDIAIHPGKPRSISPDEYAANLKEIFERLAEQTAAKVIWATTTPVIDERHARVKGFIRHEADVQEYNRIALEVAGDVPVNDLHAAIVTAGTEECLSADGCHMTDKGNKVLARATAAKVREAAGLAG
jgi:lysophospholipase L1-like esterase